MPGPGEDPERPRAARPQPHPLDLAWIRLGDGWSWIAVVPAEADVDVAKVGSTLCTIGEALTSRRVTFVDAGRISTQDEAARLLTELRRQREDPAEGRIVSLPSVLRNPGALEVARAADGVVLCARRGTAPLAAVRETIARVEAHRVVLALLLDEAGAAVPS